MRIAFRKSCGCWRKTGSGTKLRRTRNVQCARSDFKTCWCMPTAAEQMSREPLGHGWPRPDGPDRATFYQHWARYEFALGQLAGGERILDAGCGTGYGT